MLIQIDTDNNIQNSTRMTNYFATVIEDELGRFRDQITRVQVHLGDENAQKQNDKDKRCMIEARLKGMEPIAVTHHADSLEQAVGGATDKLKKTLDHSIGKLRNH